MMSTAILPTSTLLPLPRPTKHPNSNQESPKPNTPTQKRKPPARPPRITRAPHRDLSKLRHLLSAPGLTSIFRRSQQ